MGASLTSDHVNYLIWRYLQEQGYGKAAIQLSREWKTDDPQSLPFAPSVKPYFLIQMLQDALAYDQMVIAARHAVERDVLGRTENNTDPAAPTVSDHSPAEKAFLGSLERRYDFVDVKQRRLSFRPQEVQGIEADPRPAKRPRPDVRRKSSKPSGLNVESRANGDAMDVDNDDAHQSSREEHMEDISIPEEPPPVIHTLEIGQSTGIQIEETKEDEKLADTIAKHEIPGADIFGLRWSDEQIPKLTASGGSAWHTMTVMPEAETNGDFTNEHEPVNSPRKISYSIRSEAHHGDADSQHVAKYAVSQTASASTADGSPCFAAAIEELHGDGSASGRIMLSAGQDMESAVLEKPASTVMALRFSLDSKHILAVWHGDGSEDAADQSFVRAWDIEGLNTAGDIGSQDMIRDAIWIGDATFVVCGEKMLDIFSQNDETLFEFRQSIETDRVWEQLRYDSDTNKLACSSSDDGTLGLVDLGTFELSVEPAHEDIITAVRWQPASRSVPPKLDSENDRPMEDADSIQPRILGTSSTDGTVKLWNTRATLQCIHTFALKDPQPVWTFEFAPDGRLIAAMCERILTVWKAEAEGEVVARWKEPAPDEPVASPQLLADNNVDQGAPRINGDHATERAEGDGDGDAQMTEETRSEDGLSPLHCLAWDHQGKRIAHALGQKISIIELPNS